jgi:FKBP-type peptidyl-prolyl cis-trans isomerase
MNKYIIPALALGLLAGTVCGQDKLELKTPKDRVSYSIGANIGKSLKAQDLDIDLKVLASGLTDAFSGKTVLTETEIRDTLETFRKEMMAKMEAKMAAQGEKNVKAGADFLADNAKKEGVKTTESGLQYKVIKSGDDKGKKPKATDTVKVHYKGTLIDGTVFDSSVDRGEPVTFPVNGVIRGWVEALQLMKEGDKWQLVIPAKLAYGEQAPPGSKIGPNETLIFEVELISIEKPEAQ